MRRLCAFLLVLLFLAAAPTFAQDAPPAVTPPPDVAQLAALATQAAQENEAAKEAFDRAINILGIFEGVGLVVSVMSILGTILAVAAGVIGFRGLSEARAEVEQSRQKIEHELAEARRQFETDIRQGREDLENVRRRLEQSVQQQRDSVAQTNVAMSFTALGERQYRSKDFSGAIDTYLRALELDPNNLITHYRLGYVYTQSGQLDQAEPHLARALELEPNFPPALAALGYVYRRMGEKMPPGMEREKKINQAEKLLLDALDIAPKLVDEDSESWWGSLGGLYRRRDQIDSAISAYERAAEVTPQSSYAFSNLALLYVHKQNREAMIKTYRRVEQLAYHEVQAEVDNYWAYADLLTSRLALGKVKEAEETLASVLDVAPPESPFFFDSLLDTLRRLAVALGEDQSGHVQRTIDVIEGYRDQRAQSGEQTAAQD